MSADIFTNDKMKLVVQGRQTFMGKEIPVVLGGFGESKRCVSDKTIAEIHKIEPKHVRDVSVRRARWNFFFSLLLWARSPL